MTVKLRCSFCGKSQDHVEKLCAGPGVNICNECAWLTFSIIGLYNNANSKENIDVECEPNP